MSAFRSNIVTVLTTELFGFGATLNPDGSVASITGATVEYVTIAPTAVRNGGSLALRSNGTLYGTAGAGVWFSIGGAGAGWNLPDDIAGIWGTSAPGQVSSVYVSASNRFDLSGDSISQATAASGTDMRIETGSNTITGAVAGNDSGFIQVRTGATDSTNAGGTGGDSGALTFSTGSAASTLGVSGSSGILSLITGDSADANSGDIVLTTGSAAGTRGVLDINVATIDTATQAVQWLAFDNSATGLQIGASGALNMLVWDTSTGTERVIGNAVGGIQTVNNVPFRIGTTANDQFSLVYASIGNIGQLTGTSITAGGATQATRPFQVATGTRTLTDAAGSPASGALTISTGGTDVSFAAGGATGGASGNIAISTGPTEVTLGANTGGPTGAILIASGGAAATAGTSGNSGGVALASGSSVNGTSGGVALTTGNVTGGTGNSGSITLTPGTSAGGLQGLVVATGLRTVGVTATAIVGATTLVQADSNGVFTVSQAAAYDIDLPSPTSGAGLRFLFQLVSPGANNVTITVAGGAATFEGTIINDTTSVIPATGATLTFATGASVLGDNIEIISTSTSKYLVRAVTSAAGGITIT